MREIKFRGKSTANFQWVYGYYLFNRFEEHLICNKDVITPVDPGTIGQFIGELDKNKNEIYEGDIVRTSYKDDLGYIDGKVVYIEHGGYWLIQSGVWAVGFGKRHRTYEVIGNIYENKELLEAK